MSKRHTMKIDDLQYEWGKKHDPLKRENPQPFLREVFSNAISNWEDVADDIDDDDLDEDDEYDEGDELIAVAKVLSKAMRHVGMEFLAAPSGITRKCRSDVVCPFQQLLFRCGKCKKPDSLLGKKVMFAKIMRGKSKCDVPVHPSMFDVLKELEDCPISLEDDF